MTCSWLVDVSRADVGFEGTLNVQFAVTETRDGVDFVRIYDGERSSAPLLVERTGLYNTTSPLYASSTSQLLVVFTAGGSDADGDVVPDDFRGIQAAFEVPKSCTQENGLLGAITGADGDRIGGVSCNLNASAPVLCSLLNQPYNDSLSVAPCVCADSCETCVAAGCIWLPEGDVHYSMGDDVGGMAPLGRVVGGFRERSFCYTGNELFLRNRQHTVLVPMMDGDAEFAYLTVVVDADGVPNFEQCNSPGWIPFGIIFLACLTFCLISSWVAFLVIRRRVAYVRPMNYVPPM